MYMYTYIEILKVCDIVKEMAAYTYLSETEAILSMGIFLLITSTNCPFMGPFLI